MKDTIYRVKGLGLYRDGIGKPLIDLKQRKDMNIR